MTTPAIKDCLFCIEGFAPSGVDFYLGPVYVACDTCTANDTIIGCPACNGNSLFPADYDFLDSLAEHLAGFGLIAVLCGGCYGVAALAPITDLSGGTP